MYKSPLIFLFEEAACQRLLTYYVHPFMQVFYVCPKFYTRCNILKLHIVCILEK